MPHSDDFLAVHDPAAPHALRAPGAAGAMSRWWAFAAALAAGLLLLCGLTWLVSVQRGIAGLEQSTAMHADRYAATLESTLDRYEFLPALVSLHPSVRGLLAAPDDPARIAAVNDYLQDVNRRARASATYVIAANGLALAASNHGEPGSFVGTDYRFRPYFQMASQGQIGRFYAIGVTSDEPGYYIAQPVEAAGRVVGVTVVKLNLEWFQRAGAGSAEPLMVSDEHGVIFLSSVPAWQYRTLRPLPPDLQAELDKTRQYHDHDVTPLPLEPLTSPVTRWLANTTLHDGARLVRVRGDGHAVRAPDGINGETSGDEDSGERFLQLSRAVGPAGWTMQVMAPLDPVLASARNATVGVALAYACICLLLVNLRQRHQRARDMQYSRRLLEAAYDELERRVEARTADLMAINEQLEDEVAERTRTEDELRATQDELVQASKLAALGQMAAGITHELNQPLAALRTFSDNTRVLIERGQMDAATGNLAAIADLTERMGKITGQLKLFAGKARPRRHAVRVRAALDHVLTLMAPRLAGVALAVHGLDAAGDAAPMDGTDGIGVWADELKLEQVLLNLLGNALDAIAANGAAARAAGRIDVTVTADADTVSVAVRDNGGGIAPDALQRLFEPFFTTKEIGQGLGLGLAISSSIVREFGGQLVASNADGGGAEFVVTLRRAHQPATAREKEEQR